MKTKLSLFCEKVIEAGWLAAVVAVPLFFNIYTARTFEPDKITLMRSITAVMILAWIIKALEEAQNPDEETSFGDRLKAWLKQPLVIPTLVILGAYGISTILSISPLVSLWGSYQRLQGSYAFASYVVIFALMASNMRSWEQVDRLITIIIVASVPVGLYGIIQRYGLDPLPWAGDVTRRVASNMGNAIFVASYLIMIVPVTLSRLIKSMTAIVTKEDASWGYTIQAAVYIFVLAVQFMAILFSFSRGPQIGLLGAAALMGLLILLILRQQAADKSPNSLIEMGYGALTAFAALAIAGVIGGLGYGIGIGGEALLGGRVALENMTLLTAAIGGIIGFVGTYVYLAATGRGWRWLWLTWPVLGAMGLTFIIVLNNPSGPLEPLRSIPYLDRLGRITNTDSGTGRVRVLIWEGSLDLITADEPLGVEGEYMDNLYPVRPLIGYGPESMFNAFAFAFPPELAQVEKRGSSADRSHNETMDTLVMTGFLGFAAFYLLVGSVFFYGLKWLGWVPDRRAAQGLLLSMVAGGLIGGLIPLFTEGTFVMSALGLPFGVFGGLFVYLFIRGLIRQPEAESDTGRVKDVVLMIGLFGAMVGHFLEVHFVFSIAATYTYFWAYLGLMFAVSKIETLRETQVAVAEGSETEEESEEQREATERKNRKNRRRSRGRSRPGRVTAPVRRLTGRDGWETVVSTYGLALAIILIILIFDFVPVQFDPSTGRYSIVWLLSITVLVTTALVFSDLAIKKAHEGLNFDWPRATLFFAVTSLGYAGFYFVLHAQQRSVLTSGRISEVLAAANALVGILAGFYIALFLLMLIIALTLVLGRTRGLPTWRLSNLLIYIPVAVAIFMFIYFKNFNVVKADIYLKEGERYRSAQQWDQAILLHEEAIKADSDEDFYYLMLALDYQLKAQDSRLSAEDRRQAWLEGERIATEARNINRYNPDNTGNLGRYYFTLGQVLDRDYYDDAINYFQKAVELAPQNVQYYNLLGQVHYVKGEFEEALTWLQESVSIDDRYTPSKILLGDTHAALGNVNEAAAAHGDAIRAEPRSFADGNFDTRINFYLTHSPEALSLSEGITVTQDAERQFTIQDEPIGGIIDAFTDYLDENPDSGQSYWALGQIYFRLNDLNQAEAYWDQAQSLGYQGSQSTQSLLSLGNTYLSESNFEAAENAYLQVLQLSPDLPEAHSSLGYIYAQTGRPEEAIAANLRVLESIPNDYASLKNLALLYQQVGQLDPAIVYAEQALAVAPDNEREDVEVYLQQLRDLQEATSSN